MYELILHWLLGSGDAVMALGPLPIIGGLIAAGSLASGAYQGHQADKDRDRALKLQTQQWNERAPLRGLAIESLTGGMPNAPDLGGVFADPSNPFAAGGPGPGLQELMGTAGRGAPFVPPTQTTDMGPTQAGGFPIDLPVDYGALGGTWRPRGQPLPPDLPVDFGALGGSWKPRNATPPTDLRDLYRPRTGIPLNLDYGRNADWLRPGR